MPAQFDTFDTLDDRREIMTLFARLGDGLPETQAGLRRARFLRSILPESVNGFKAATLRIDPCSAVEAYRLFGAITGCLGVPISVAAAKLTAAVRAQR
jgi:hypothetical protein